jgi:hypothetical protein
MQHRVVWHADTISNKCMTLGSNPHRMWAILLVLFARPRGPGAPLALLGALDDIKIYLPLPCRRCHGNLTSSKLPDEAWGDSRREASPESEAVPMGRRTGVSLELLVLNTSQALRSFSADSGS